MCGIAGFLGAPGPALAAVRDWGGCLAHRGPDDLGVAVLGEDGLHLGRDAGRITAGSRAVLWHRRLSILDLSPAGWQPMSSADGRHHLILNGEIYNYLELRAELEREGVRFRSRSDTEVLLEAWRRWGAGVLPRLTGMFAFALLDTVGGRLVLARDPFGIKPLLHAGWTGGFAFASEPKALLALPQVSRRVDAQRVYDYLRFGLTDHGDGSMFAAIRSLPPGHWMEVALDDPRPGAPQRYWAPDPVRRFAGTFEQAADELRARFLDSVRLLLRSDVPVGAALSGGVDSSAIVGAMRALEPGLELHAFSYVADDPALSEERWVELAAGASRAVVHRTRASAGDLLADLGPLLAAQDEPFGSTSIYAQHRVFRLAREQGIKVMLDGQGADELLGGYHTFAAARLASLVRQGRLAEAVGFARRASAAPGRGALLLWAGEFLLPPGVQAPFRRLVGQELVPAWLDARWFAERGVRLQPAKYTFGASREVLREQLVRATTHSSLPMLLRYEDRNSMAHSIESRVPFLTTGLADFVLGLPEHYIVNRDGGSKAVFRRAMRGLVPDAILDRRDKIGFATPEHVWLPALAPHVERLLADARLARIPALRPEPLRAEWRAILARRPRRDFRAWRWVNLIEWAHRTGADFS
jgi:asparagine synthase (glutamine-hydrolysing)